MIRSLAQESVCRQLDAGRTLDLLVVVTANEDLKGVRRMVAASMPENTRGFGSTWVAPSGKVVQVKRYEDSVPEYGRRFQLMVCANGLEYTTAQKTAVGRWRKAEIKASPQHTPKTP